MNILVLLPDRNSPPKVDFSGAFNPAAQVLGRLLKAEVHKLPVPVVDPDTLIINSHDKQRQFEAAGDRVLELVASRQWDRIVFLCHGWSTGLQLGLRSAKEHGGDAHRFRKFCLAVRGTGAIVLYACSTGDSPGSERSKHLEGKGSFAEELNIASGVPVLTHWTAGHTTRNPDLIYLQHGAGEEIFARGSKSYRQMRTLLASKPRVMPSGGYPYEAWVQAILEAASLKGLRKLYSSPSEAAP